MSEVSTTVTSKREGKRYWMEMKNWAEMTDPNNPDSEYNPTRSLWSPQFRIDGRRWPSFDYMKEVKRGDVMLHYRLGDGIVGLSVVESEKADITFPKWAERSGVQQERPGYFVKLNDYVELDQAITKEDIFVEENKEKLRKILEKYQREERLFYTRDMGIVQGVYLSSVPDELMSLLNGIYRKKTGKDLPYYESEGTKEKYYFGVNVWKASAGVESKHLEYFREHGIFSIGPYDPNEGNLDRFETEDQLKANFPNLGYTSFHLGGSQLIYIWKRMDVGDILLVYRKGTIADFGVVKSDYKYDDQKEGIWEHPNKKEELMPGWQHYREVEWLNLNNPINIDQFLTEEEKMFFTNPPATVRLLEDKNKELLRKIFDRTPSEVIEKLRELTRKYKRVPNPPISEPAADDTVTEKVTNPLNIILYGPPGTGKTYATKAAVIAIEKGEDVHQVFRNGDLKKYMEYNTDVIESCKGRIKRVTFHPSYSYEDFIEGITAETSNGQIQYKVKNGVFKDLAIKAKNDPQKNYYLIIDEINRGNISKIFGELITLIEEDKRRDSPDDDCNACLPYSKEEFAVPRNLYLIGTMNTADRSIALVDLALRRRFEFIELMPRSELLRDAEVRGVLLEELLKTINDRIKSLGERDKQIGHAYFMDREGPIKDVSRLKNVWFYKVLPLLNEYFYGRWEDIAYVLSGKKDFGESSEVPFLEKLDEDEDIYDFKGYMEDEDFIEELKAVFQGGQ